MGNIPEPYASSTSGEDREDTPRCCECGEPLNIEGCTCESCECGPFCEECYDEHLCDEEEELYHED